MSTVRTLRLFVGTLLVMVCLSACSQQAGRPAADSAAFESDAADRETTTLPQSVQDTAGEQARARATDAGTGAATASPAMNARKIIYNTTLSLVVKDYDEFEAKLPALVESVGGFISKSETSRRYSDQQSGMWVARIPVDRYSGFLASVSGLGFAESRREDAKDVTDEFVDVEARIRNSKKLEERIITLLDERTGKISDVLEIERELARVREEIERMEGRLRLLADQSALATVTIQCREEREYEPPTAPTLGSRIRKSWENSLNSMQTVAESLLVATVAIAPWLGVLAVPVILIVAIFKRRRRNR